MNRPKIPSLSESSSVPAAHMRAYRLACRYHAIQDALWMGLAFGATATVTGYAMTLIPERIVQAMLTMALALVQ